MFLQSMCYALPCISRLSSSKITLEDALILIFLQLNQLKFQKLILVFWTVLLVASVVLHVYVTLNKQFKNVSFV